MTTDMKTAVICSALLALLVFALGANVSRMRGTASTQFPTDPTDPLFVAVRAHGNATEYVPTRIVLILFIGASEPSAWMLVIAVAAVVARYVHAVGIFVAGDMARATPLRLIGAIGTYLCGFGLIAAALVETF
jgi:uncharacterized membrane protein YecN with MAPEG domain